MKIKANQSFGNAVSKDTYQAGVEYDLADLYAAELVDAGLVEIVEQPPVVEQPQSPARKGKPTKREAR